ncbi:MAG: DUF58 domain-containing protein [Actinobacteria bacterium]|nr:DUF58 domain-containing protein [Actinomycetota bacterium]
MSPTPLAAAIVLILAIATVLLPLPLPISLLALAALCGVAAVDVRIAHHAHIGVSRDLPATLVRGFPARIAISAFAADSESTGRSARVWSFSRIRQPLPSELSMPSSEGDIHTDARHTTEELADAEMHPVLEVVGNLVASHRGMFVLPPLSVRVIGPMHLMRCDYEIGSHEPIKVIPDLPGARARAVALRRGRLRSDEGRSRGRMGLGTELESVREWTPDDDIRRVNWAATSRTGRYMSNQYRIEENRNVICMIDTGRLMASPLGDATRLDIALDAVCAVAAIADDAGDRVGAIAFADRVIHAVPPRRYGTQVVVEALYDLQPEEVESNYELAFHHVGREKRSVLVVLTDLIDETAAGPLLSSIPILARRHAVLVGSVADPLLAQAVEQEPSRPYDVYRAVAALSVLEEKRRVAALLRRRGALVVEAHPSSFGAACVAGYLDLKRRAWA